jgi:inositol polyphosphate-4-phosphatase
MNNETANYDENGFLLEDPSATIDHNRKFLETKVNLSSDFYRPSEEPEPLDLTQLNIEASVMCLVRFLLQFLPLKILY